VLVKNPHCQDNVFVFGAVNTFCYKNHRSEVSMRSVIPLQLRWGDADGYYKDEWLLECFDVEKNDYRTFALSGIEPR
jgi:predicted DNA-binding transcriptional regulator YafY